MKILNLYAGIGGNRKLWPAEHEVTSVEYDPDIAAVYADLYPQDTLVIGDAHAYLLEQPGRVRLHLVVAPLPVAFPDALGYVDLVRHHIDGTGYADDLNAMLQEVSR